MRRLEVRFRPTALEDMESIYLFVFRASASRQVAENFVNRILERCRRIGDAPFGGPAREDLEPGLRIASFERSAVIAYLVEESCVRITNVFYGGRDYEAFYRRGEADDKSGRPASRDARAAPFGEADGPAPSSPDLTGRP